MSADVSQVWRNAGARGERARPELPNAAYPVSNDFRPGRLERTLCRRARFYVDFRLNCGSVVHTRLNIQYVRCACWVYVTYTCACLEAKCTYRLPRYAGNDKSRRLSSRHNCFPTCWEGRL